MHRRNPAPEAALTRTPEEQARVDRLIAADDRRREAATRSRQKRREEGERTFSAYVPSAIYGDLAPRLRELIAEARRKHAKAVREASVVRLGARSSTER